MKRTFLILLMLLLPMQFSFAAGMRYCADETAAASEHFGHHQHMAGADAHKAEGEHASNSPEPSGGEFDCHYCHSVSASVPVVIAALSASEFGLPPKVVLPLSAAQYQPLPLQRPPIASLA